MTLLKLQKLVIEKIFCNTISFITLKQHFGKCLNGCARLKAKYLPKGEGPFGALPANLKFIHWFLCIRKNRKIEPQEFEIF